MSFSPKVILECQVKISKDFFTAKHEHVLPAVLMTQISGSLSLEDQDLMFMK